MPKKIIYIFQNSFWGKDIKTSGGDVRVAYIFKKIQVHFLKIIIFGNKEAFLFNMDYGPNAHFVITPELFDKFGICISYFLRTIFVVWQLFFLQRDGYLYSASDFFPDVLPAYIFKNKNNKWIQIIHHIYPSWKTRPGNIIINFVGYYLQRLSFFLINNKADRIVVVSPFVKEGLLNLGFDKNKIHVSSNAIDIENLDKIKEKKQGYDGVFLGRLNYSKGVFDLIEIWKNIYSKYYDAKLGIIGGGEKEIRDSLLKKIKEYDLEKNIDILGYLKYEEVFAILKASKIFLFPSHEEGWGIAIAEAMACNLPVVSWGLSVYKSIFGDHTIQVKENDINLFSEKVAELLQNESKRAKIGISGYEFIKKYSWDNIAMKELELINNL